jgi:preprotein translocase subunit SecB
METETADTGLVVAQVYVESAQFSHRADALSLPPETKLEVGDVQVEITLAEAPEGDMGFIRIAVRTNPALNPMYNVGLTMIGVVTHKKGETPPKVTVRQFLTGGAVSFMYPFLREAFANLTGRGRFGAVWLNPIDARVLAAQLTKAHAEAAPIPVDRGLSTAPSD